MKVVLVPVIALVALGCARKDQPLPPTSALPPLPGDVSSLCEPPDDAPHGPSIGSLALGLWSEEDTYPLNARMNVWKLLTNRPDMDGRRIPYDETIHQNDYLHIRDSGDREVRVQGCHPCDGPVGLGYAGGISELLHEQLRAPGVYELQWKIGELESNILRLTVVEPETP